MISAEALTPALSSCLAASSLTIDRLDDEQQKNAKLEAQVASLAESLAESEAVRAELQQNLNKAQLLNAELHSALDEAKAAAEALQEALGLSAANRPRLLTEAPSTLALPQLSFIVSGCAGCSSCFVCVLYCILFASTSVYVPPVCSH